MTRTLFARGAKGELIQELQRTLGIPNVTGNYFDQTVAAVQAEQTKRGMVATGIVDFDLWPPVMGRPVPPVFERALQLTAAFEGSGFTLAEGNFDGAGLTWGFIGFTLHGGELAKVIGTIDQQVPGALEADFGNLLPVLKQELAATWDEQLVWANSISLGKSRAQLLPEWRDAFARLGARPEVQRVQFQRARDVYKPLAERIAADWNLTSELGFALSFDIAVQNSYDEKLRAMIAAALAAHPIERELDTRVLIAHAVSQHSLAQFQADVLARKLLIATGSGVAHGVSYTLTSWGLSDV
jgi:peptidoglycan hydrolase-like protein with peptidoglycan-binding domain